MRYRNTNLQLIVEIAASLLVLLFLYAALSKLARITFFIHQLNQFPYLRPVSVLVAWMVPLVEILASIMLLISRFQKIGFALSIGLLMSFTVYLAFMILFHKENLPCSCGGVLKYLSWGQHVIFNLVFLLIATVGWLSANRIHGSGPAKSEHDKNIMRIIQENRTPV